MPTRHQMLIPTFVGSGGEGIDQYKVNVGGTSHFDDGNFPKWHSTITITAPWATAAGVGAAQGQTIVTNNTDLPNAVADDYAWGTQRYDFFALPGVYQVDVYGAEFFHAASGLREFDIAINDVTVASSVDWYDLTGGQGIVHKLSYEVTVSPSSEPVIKIDLTNVTDNAALSAIKIVRLSGGVPASYYAAVNSIPGLSTSFFFGLDETSGTNAADRDGGGTYDGTYDGPTLAAGTTPWGDPCPDFDGVNDKVTLVAGTWDGHPWVTVVKNKNDYSMFSWSKIDVAPGSNYRHVARFFADASNDIRHGQDGAAANQWYQWDIRSGGFRGANHTQVTQDVWQFNAGHFDNLDKVSNWLQGNFQVLSAAHPNAWSGVLTIAGISPSGNWPGLIGPVFGYESDPSAAQHKILYVAGYIPEMGYSY